MTKEELVTIARGMSADDRAFIVAAIDPTEDAPTMADDVAAELHRRLALIDSGQMPMLTRGEFNARVASLRSVDR